MQKGSVVLIHRKDISSDDINPRQISAENAKRLKESIKKNGLVGHLVWNKTTGHIVGGHQRLDALDSIMRTENYELEVLQVEMPLKDEVRLNVVLNNTDSQGVFDFNKIQELSFEFGLDIASDFGFSNEVIDIQFPKVAEIAQFTMDESSPLTSYEPPAPKTASEEDIAKMKEMKKAARDELKEGVQEVGKYTGEAKGILTVVFNCESDKKEWLKSINLPEDKNIVNIEDIEIPLVEEITKVLKNGGERHGMTMDSQ